MEYWEVMATPGEAVALGEMQDTEYYQPPSAPFQSLPSLNVATMLASNGVVSHV